MKVFISIVNCGSCGWLRLMNCGRNVEVNSSSLGLLMLMMKLLWNRMWCDVGVIVVGLFMFSGVLLLC